MDRQAYHQQNTTRGSSRSHPECDVQMQLTFFSHLWRRRGSLAATDASNATDNPKWARTGCAHALVPSIFKPRTKHHQLDKTYRPRDA